MSRTTNWILAGAFGIAAHGNRGEQHQRNMLEAGIRFDFLPQFFAGHIGHLHVR